VHAKWYFGILGGSMQSGMIDFFIASRILTATITIPLPFTIAEGEPTWTKYRSTASQVQQLQQKVAEQDVTI